MWFAKMSNLFLIVLLVTQLATVTVSKVVTTESEQVVSDAQWKAWMTFHNKTYESKYEESYRKAIWLVNLQRIIDHNKAGHTFTLGMNQFGDLTFAEYRFYMLGATYPGNTTKSRGSTFLPPTNVQYPTEVDWRTQGYVTPVKNQEQCGSCWAFSSTGSLEGQHFKKTGKLVSLSEQNLVDCVKTNRGCFGGWMDNAFMYIRDNDGIDTEQSYPYYGRELGYCAFRREYVGATDTGFIDIPKGSESSLLAAVATVGPISVAIDASHPSFMAYSGGVYYEQTCSSTKLDHAVLVVGYGTTDGQDYWLVKNSWGTNWGMNGYVMMARNRNNLCGIATAASYPLV